LLELAPGPVEMPADVLRLGACQTRYFRTDRFSRWMLALKAKFLGVLGLGPACEIVFLTGSGTAGMEAVAANFLPRRHHLALSAGQFGERMGEISRRRRFRFDTVSLDATRSPQDNLAGVVLSRYESCFSTISETSNGYYLDPKIIRDAGLPRSSLLLCDGVSAAFADDFDPCLVDALIIGSQKGLGLAPGMCFIALSEPAIDFLKGRKPCPSLYFDFTLYIDNMKRGQTPFTPGLTILYQLDRALDAIAAGGGLGPVTARRKSLADRLRTRLDGHGIQYIGRYVSNCVTVIQTGAIDAESIVAELQNTYNITAATNSPPLKKTHFRVSHMGNNTLEDMDRAADAIGLCMKERS
jgi:aspartate aminotransferase-like enzyme